MKFFKGEKSLELYLVTQCLLSMVKALSSIPKTIKKERKEYKMGGRERKREDLK